MPQPVAPACFAWAGTARLTNAALSGLHSWRQVLTQATGSTCQHPVQTSSQQGTGCHAAPASAALISMHCFVRPARPAWSSRPPCSFTTTTITHRSVGACRSKASIDVSTIELVLRDIAAVNLTRAGCRVLQRVHCRKRAGVFLAGWACRAAQSHLVGHALQAATTEAASAYMTVSSASWSLDQSDILTSKAGQQIKAVSNRDSRSKMLRSSEELCCLSPSGKEPLVSHDRQGGAGCLHLSHFFPGLWECAGLLLY